MRIVNGIPCSPYFVFIRDISDYDDLDVLKLLEFESFEEIEMMEFMDDHDCIYLSRDRNWTHIMDNSNYTFWCSSPMHERIERLGRKYEIFTCMVGDVDQSYEFRYYRGGVKIREHIVESPNYSDEVVKVNYGVPLDVEKDVLQLEDPLDRVIQIAQSLGLRLPTVVDQMKCFRVGNLDFV